MTPKQKTRPRDWQPLADSDPTPGDPEGVRLGAKNMATTGEQIRAQITRLKAIADTDELKGKYVDELKNGSDKLKDKLEKAAGRYERVSGKLSEWADCLDEAQTETAAALTSAKEAQDTFRALVGTTDLDSDVAKQAEKDLDATKKAELERARTKFENAKGRSSRAVGEYGKDAKRIGDKIRDILDDAVEDGIWSWFSNLIERNLKAIKVVLEIAGWVATILAAVALVIMIAALFMVPGAGWLAAMAIMMKIGTWIAVGTAVAHTAMAATGNGGWGDVAYDVLGLLTMKMGTIAAKGVKQGAQTAKKASVDAGRQQAKDVRQSEGFKNTMKQYEADKAAAPNKRVRNAIQKQQDAFVKSQKPKGAAQQLPNPTPKEVLKAGGDRDLAANLKYAQNEAAKRAGDDATTAAANKAARNGRVAFGAFTGGTALDWTDKTIAPSDVYEDKFKVEPYGDAKDWNWDKTGMYDHAP